MPVVFDLFPNMTRNTATDLQMQYTALRIDLRLEEGGSTEFVRNTSSIFDIMYNPLDGCF